MPKITGISAATRRLQRMGPEVERFVSGALQTAGDEIKAEAQHLITTNSAGGSSGGKHQHIPSRPGEPPNNFSGHLASNIEVTQPDPLRVLVTSNARYSSALEHGTSRMLARPFMSPAARAKKKRAKELVNKAVDIALKRKGQA